MEPVTVSFLTTGTDYADCKTAAMKAAMRRGEAVVFRASGAAVVLLAFALMLFGGGSVLRGILYILLALLGFAACGFPDVLLPLIVRFRALKEYESGKSRIPAQTVEFHEDFIAFLSEHYNARIPYDMLFRAYEDDKIFIFYLGIGEMRFVPKRSMDDDGCKTVRGLLAARLKDKFQQEGAH